MNQHPRHSIKKRLFFLSVLPAAALAFLISGYFMGKRLVDLDYALNDKGQTLAMQLSAVASHQLTHGRHEDIRSMLEQLLRKQGIENAIVSSDTHGVFLQARPPQDNAQFVKFTAPLINYVGDGSEPLGNIELFLSRDETDLRKQQVLWETFLITFVFLLLTVVIAWRIGRNISRPIHDLSEAVERMQQGDLSTRVAVSSEGELGRLQSGFNSMAQALQQAHDDMQANVDQATGDLQTSLEEVEIKNAQLDIARKRALEASRAKSEFLANISHEIRTPMNAIHGFSKLLIKSPLPAEHYEYAGAIQQSSAQLMTIINDVLDYARLESGQTEPVSTPFQLRLCLEKIIQEECPSAYRQHLELVLLIYDDVPLDLEGDPGFIRQILLHLINNAVKFTKEGKVVVRVMLEDEDDEQVQLRISVEDTGIGIPEEDQARLFSAFSPLDASETRRYSGNGLGLVIACKLAQAMKGNIDAESTPGQGSTFWLVLPLKRCQSVLHAENGCELLHGKRVLVYEEQAQSKAALMAHLRRWQMQIEVLDTPLQLQTRLQHAPAPALILVGLQCRQLSDEQKALLDLLHREDTPAAVVMLGAESPPDDAAYPDEQCGFCYLPKPAAADKLRETLVEQLQCKDRSRKKQEPAAVYPDFSALKILVVDDNSLNRLLMVSLLGKTGAQVIQAEGGQEAIDFAGDDTFDLILMDIHMPGVSGLDATSAIRANQKGSHTSPILALSANTQQEMQQKASAVGFQDYLTKPLDDEQLWSAIARALPGRYPDLETEYKPPLACVQENLPVYDRDQALRLAGGSDELADELLQRFIDELDSALALIQQGLDQEDAEQAYEHTHRLHGSAAYCGVPALKNAAHRLEEAVKAGIADNIDKQHKELLKAAAQLQELVSNPRD